MKRPNIFNLIEENEQHKQKAQLLTSNRNYREVIKCYEKIAKNIKIEKKAEEDKASKSLLKSKLKKIKTLIKILKTVLNSLNEIFSNDKYFFFKDIQDTYYFFENSDISDDICIEPVDTFESLDINIDVCIEQDDVFRTPKKICYSCKREITLLELNLANPSIDEDHLKKLFESPYIEFYCCNCYEIKSPYSIVRDLISYLNLLEKNIIYPMKRIWNFKISNYKKEELKFYLEEVIKIKNDKPNDLTQDANLISLIKEFIPDFTIEDSTIIVHKTVFYNKFEDYEKAIILMGRASPFFGEMFAGDDSIPIPKRFKTSNFSKAKGFFYKKEIWSNKFYLTDFGDRKFFQISFQIEKKINAHLELSNTFKMFFNF